MNERIIQTAIQQANIIREHLAAAEPQRVDCDFLLMHIEALRAIVDTLRRCQTDLSLGATLP